MNVLIIMPVIFDTINRLTKNLNTLQAKIDQYEKDFIQLRESSGAAQNLLNDKHDEIRLLNIQLETAGQNAERAAVERAETIDRLANSTKSISSTAITIAVVFPSMLILIIVLFFLIYFFKKNKKKKAKIQKKTQTHLLQPPQRHHIPISVTLPAFTNSLVNNTTHNNIRSPTRWSRVFDLDCRQVKILFYTQVGIL
jgi:predicted PurR-regulated permease PerM